MIRKFKKFTQLSAAEKALFLEAYYTLGMMRAGILTLSFKRLSRKLQHFPKAVPLPELDEKQRIKAENIGRAVVRAAAFTPWESACLAQSLTAQKMLEKRGIPGVFYLGVAKDETEPGKMNAHAWTQCGEHILTGSGGHQAFTVVSVFGWNLPK